MISLYKRDIELKNIFIKEAWKLLSLDQHQPVNFVCLSIKFIATLKDCFDLF